MKAPPRPQTGDGMAVLGALLLIVLEGVALVVAPARYVPLVSSTLVVAATCTLIVVLAVAHHHRRATRKARQRLPEAVDEPLFSSDALEGFPMEAFRPLLLAPDSPDLNRLYTAWIFSIHGYDAAWIERHLDLAADIVHTLIKAAHQRGQHRTA
jgi:hypothetical protein